MVMSQRLSSRKFSFSKLFSGFQWNLVLKVKRKKKKKSRNSFWRGYIHYLDFVHRPVCKLLGSSECAFASLLCLKTGTDPFSERQRFKFYFESGMMAKPKWCRF